MFILNLKLKPSKKLCVAVSVLAVVFAIICVASMVAMQNSVSEFATCDEIGKYSLEGKTEECRAKFLEQFGLVAEGKSVECQAVKIPEQFNETYKMYNGLQKQMGLNLEKFCGKSAEKFTYKLKNSKTKYAVMLVYKGKVIGAHLTNGEYGQNNLPLI